MKKVFFVLLISSLLFGCSSQTASRPDDVREEIWYNAKDIYNIMKKFVEIRTPIDPLDEIKIQDFTKRHGFTLQPVKDGYTEKEGYIVSTIYLFYVNYQDYKNAIEIGDNNTVQETLNTMKGNLEYLDQYF